jgi:hypothetical protein
VEPSTANLHLHPRVEQQGLSAETMRELLSVALAKLVPFRDHAVDSTFALLDWDHRLPSKALTVRLHVLYDAGARERFRQALQRRQDEIQARNRYPEFDVPDYSGLPSDEAYDVELSSELTVEAIRLVSPWRREVAAEDAAAAVGAVRRSPQFDDLQRAVGARAPGLGDLEAVAWTPPCESGLTGWTLDVWWLISFDGRVGRGWSFLVEVDAPEPPVRAAREFNIRAG